MFSPPACSVFRLFRNAIVIGLLAIVSVAFAAEMRKTFNVAAGDASETLKRFAQQAGHQIVYPAQEVRGIRTNAVQGEFTVQEGADRLLAGTVLKAVIDERSGSLAVSRVAVAEGAAPASGEKPRARTSGRTASAVRGAPVEGAAATEGSGNVTGRIQNLVTSQYLANVRVSIAGTDQAAFTDEYGVYRFNDVPAGEVSLDVFYTGLDPQRIVVSVVAGATVEQDVVLTNVKRYGEPNQTVKLGEFVVTGAKELEGESLAINEQRFARNIKNVVSSDAFGDVAAGNIAEFMKFMPGVAVDYEDAMPMTVAVRGFAANMTAVSIDGDQTANATSTGLSRTFQFKQVSINNTSRIEVTKVPTPANPADSLAGSVNMVSKSAFERAGAQFNYKVYLVANGDELTLKSTPYSDESYTHKTLPAFEFDYTLPVTKNFGLVITGLKSDQFNLQNHSTKTYRYAGTGTGASAASTTKPFLDGYTLIDAPKYVERSSGSIRADWRIAPHSVLSVSAQGTYYRDDNGNYTLNFATGTNGTPTPATGVPLSYGDNFTTGATGRGAVSQSGLMHHISGATVAGNTRYRFDNGDWRIEAGLSRSESRSWRRYIEEGNFNQLITAMTQPVRVSYEEINETKPGRIRVFDNNNREVDIYDIRNYRVNGADAPSWGDVRDRFDSGNFNLRRRLNLLDTITAVQVGGLRRVQNREVRLQAFTWTYNPPDGNAAATPFASQVFANRSNYFGFDSIPWASPSIAYRAWEKNPALFSMTPAQIAAAEVSRINNTLDFREAVDAAYLQFDFGLFKNKLKGLTGVRFERTTDTGAGPSYEPSAVFAKDAAGNFLRDAAGNRIRRPEAGAAGSLEEVKLTRQERALRARRTYDGYYPSLHLNFAATEQLMFRAAYAKTFGRPNLGEVIPNITITENDPTQTTQVVGTINVRNPGLRPWSADNYDFTAEYYTPQGGFFTAGVFLKEIKDFFGDYVTDATLEDLQALDLDDRYVGWRVTTRRNIGDARVTGYELNATHSLEFLGGWGRTVKAFANMTQLKLEGAQEASFSGFLPKSINWGFTFSKGPVVVIAKWNHRGRQRLGRQTALGSGAFQYWEPRTMLDLNVDLRVQKRLSLFANARNVFNKESVLLAYGPDTPGYAKQISVREYGVQISAGIKGSF